MNDREIIIKKGSFGSLMMGFLIGGLIGAGVALLAAPQSGAETRAMIGDKTSELRDRAMSMADDTRKQAQQMISNVKDQASDTVQKAMNRASDAMQKGQQSIQS